MTQLKWTALAVGVAALVSAVAVGAAAQAGATQATKASTTAQAPKAQAARVQALSGTIAAYDASGNTLTIKTATGDQTVSIGANTRIREGSKTLKAADLAGLTGRNVKVRCRESGGKLVADSITIAPAGK
jgi:F0F1-type ATP synthase membrane subunit c/vacuolar-type H+-ATPase subunit K